MPPLFALETVSFAVDGVPVLHDVTLDLPDAGITTIVGPSGSGKSTLLRLFNRLERPTAGSVRFRGEALDDVDVRTLRRRVGMVFQRPTVFDGTSFANLCVARPDLSEAGAVDAMERVGLPAELLTREARRLSGGEAQRLCLARTLLTEPDVVLMDEPTSSLDEESVHRIEHVASEVVDGGTRMIWVSHDREQVRRVGSWIVRLDRGRVVDSGPATAMGHVHQDDQVWVTGPDPVAEEEGAP